MSAFTATYRYRLSSESASFPGSEPKGIAGPSVPVCGSIGTTLLAIGPEPLVPNDTPAQMRWRCAS